jgi:hypothetical protein
MPIRYKFPFVRIANHDKPFTLGNVLAFGFSEIFTM